MPTLEELEIYSQRENPRYLPAHKVYLETAVNLMPKGYCQWCGKSLAGTRSRRFCPPIENRYVCGLAWFFFWQSTPTFKRAVMIRDNFTCVFCGVECITKNKHGVTIPALGEIEIDHIIPVAKGGKATLDNLQTACKKCNRKKGAKLDFTPQPELFNLEQTK